LPLSFQRNLDATGECKCSWSSRLANAHTSRDCRRSPWDRVTSIKAGNKQRRLIVDIMRPITIIAATQVSHVVAWRTFSSSREYLRTSRLYDVLSTPFSCCLFLQHPQAAYFLKRAGLDPHNTSGAPVYVSTSQHRTTSSYAMSRMAAAGARHFEASLEKQIARVVGAQSGSENDCIICVSMVSLST